MEFTIATLLFLLINTVFLPYDNLMSQRHFRNLIEEINDVEIHSHLISATDIMEKIFSFSEKYYKFIKNKINYDKYKKYAQDIVVAGLSETVTPEGVCGAKLFLAVFFLLYLLICGTLLGVSFFTVMSPIGAIIGFIYPDTFLKSKIKSRQWQIQKELPSVLSTLAIVTEAGLGLFESIERVCEIRSGEFIKELKKVNEEVKVGVLRKEAFLKLSERCQVNEVSSFVSALLQLLEKGSSGISKFLKEQSAELWNKRINHARELGAKASLKLFVPMLLLVLPATLIFLAGPVLIEVLSKFFE